MKKIGIAYHDLFLAHDAGPTHPDVAERITTIMEQLKKTKWFNDNDVFEAPEASVDDIARVHNPNYVEAMRRLCDAGGEYLASMEATVGEETYPAALRAAGAGLALADGVIEGKFDIGFAPTRPPGHHAIWDRPRGFCVFNNIAITARYLQAKHGLKRIAIFDFDVHHGNGTETTFLSDADVLYCSVHRDNLFPYDRGRVEDKGVDDGESFTVNVPLKRGSDDVDYLRAIDTQILRKVIEHEPEIILISTGFDAHTKDILGGMNLSTQGYADIASRVNKMAEGSAQGRIINLLEGGYTPQYLAEGVVAYLGRLLQD